MTFNVYARGLMEPSRGKGAVFIRAFLEYLNAQSDIVNLREAQEAGIQGVLDKGASISLNYVKTCGRNLQQAELIEQTRAGKGWSVEITDQGEAFLQALPNDWGTDPIVDSSASEVNDPGAMVEVEEKPNRRMKASHPMPRAVWKAYYAAFKAGELDIVFVQPHLKVKLVRKDS